MIDCCHVAIALALANMLQLVCFFGYNLKWRNQQVELSKRTEQLEKKNGKEFKELEKLKAEKKLLEAQIKVLKRKRV